MIPVIHIIPILDDNYCYLIEGADKHCLIIDPGESPPVKQYLMQNNLTAMAILNTHHHGDHVAGNADFDLPVIAPESEHTKIPAVTRRVCENDIIEQCGISLNILETPGHTKGHIVFYCPAASALFSGDTLFSLGCGRLFEGSAEDMYQSLQKIKQLPPETNIYCGHEYTLSNGKFAVSIDAKNTELQKRMDNVQSLRSNNRPTIPVTLAQELKTNPFLRVKDSKEFADLRKQKDRF